METFVIQKGIPIPKNNKGHRRSKYPFGKMEVGDSFIFSEEYSRAMMQYALTCSNSWRKQSPGKSDWEFLVRKVKLDNNKSGARIWRVE